MRRALKNLFAFLLRHTAQYAKFFSLCLELLVVGETMKDLLFRLITDGAGVVENEVGILDRRHLAISLRHERANHFLRIVHVHLAAKSFEVERPLGLTRHMKPV